MSQRERAQQLRISDVLYTMSKHRVLILVMTIVGLLIGILLSVVSYMRGEMSKQYAITSTIAVVSQTKDGLFSTRTSNPVSQDIYLAENMVDSVIYLMKSDRTLDAAVGKLSLVGITPRDIAKNFTLSQYNSTQIIEMTLYWRSAEEGVQILTAINEVAPGILIDTLKIGDVSVVNKPTARYLIGGNVNASMWVYMALLGMMAGVGFSVLMLLLYPTVINIRDLESDFGLEVLGNIPQDKACFARKRALLVNDADNSDFEHIRQSFATTAHILGNRLGPGEHQCIFVTSAAPNEGKTTVVANLAIHLSDLEKRVLIVDFDVRHPSLGSMFLDKVDYIHSLNALYRGETTAAEAVTTLTGYLDLLPSILEPHELPLDDAMMNLVRELSVHYDYVLMDTSPVGRVASTMNLNRIAKSAIFVISYDKTTKEEINQSLEKMDKSGVRVIGCVINGVRKNSRDAWGYNGSPTYYSGRKPAAPSRGIPVSPADSEDSAEDAPADVPGDEPLSGKDRGAEAGMAADETSAGSAAQAADWDDDDFSSWMNSGNSYASLWDEDEDNAAVVDEDEAASAETVANSADEGGSESDAFASDADCFGDEEAAGNDANDGEGETAVADADDSAEDGEDEETANGDGDIEADNELSSRTGQPDSTDSIAADADSSFKARFPDIRFDRFRDEADEADADDEADAPLVFAVPAASAAAPEMAAPASSAKKHKKKKKGKKKDKRPAEASEKAEKKKHKAKEKSKR